MGARGPAAPEASLNEGDSDAVRFRKELDEVLAIGRALSSERDIRKLLDLILAKARQITGADAGSVYIVEPGQVLHFMLAHNDSLPLDLAESRMPIDEKSIVGQAVLSARPINVADLERLSVPGENPAGLRHNRSFDERSGYRTRSMLTVPMLSAHEEVIGVIQLINRKRDRTQPLRTAEAFDSNVVAFDAGAVQTALALASQAGICLENAILYDEIRSLFEGFVDASVKAIEARDPTTSGHSRRVATLSVALAERVDALGDGPLARVYFSRDDLRQIEYAGVLHDFGKVGVREHVLTKAKKLHDAQRAAIELRFRYIRRTIEAESLQRKLDLALAALAGGAGAPPLGEVDAETAARLVELDRMMALIRTVNEPTLQNQPVLQQISDIAALEYLDSELGRRPYLEPGELQALRIERGSLTADERREIESHVTHTMAFLETIPWGRMFSRVAEIAGAHHESLDGRGYPRGLKGEEIPIEARMLTIADIFDALTASDRPYKAAVPVPRALQIIESEVKNGRCDAALFDVFVGAGVYKVVTGGH